MSTPPSTEDAPVPSTPVISTNVVTPSHVQTDSLLEIDNENDNADLPTPSTKRSFSNVGDEESLNEPTIIPKKRNKKSSPETWIKNIKLKKKHNGGAYQARKKDNEGKWKFVDVQGKKRSSRCTKKSCKDRGRRCYIFTHTLEHTHTL